MNGDILKQFLVGIGFGVDEKSFKSAMKFVADVTTKVTIMAGAIKAVTAATFFGISKIAEGFEQIGYEQRLVVPAINKAILLRKAMQSAYKDAGIDMVKAVQASIKFNFSLAKTKFQLEGIVKSTAMKFVPMLTKQMDIFREKIRSNMPKILSILERVVKFIFKAFEGVVLIGTRLWSILSRVWDFLERLDTATDGWSTKILALAAAWKFLNLSFLATPIGMLLTGLLAILALYDDFMTWKEGGESLFDWGDPAVKTVMGVVAAVVGMLATFKAATIAIAGYKALMVGLTFAMGVFKTVLAGVRIAMLLAMLNPIGLIVTAVTGLIALIVLLITKWDTIKKSIGGFFSGIGEKVMDFVGGDVNKNLTVQPLGSSGGNNTSQNVKQETNIIVQGSGDPNATARQVVTQQNQVNFNMARNMKGAAR